MDNTRLVYSPLSDTFGLISTLIICGCRSKRRVANATTHPPNRRAGVVLLAIVAIFAVRASAQDHKPDLYPSSIRGTVINAVTHEAIGRALVYTQDNRFAAWTDGEGHFDYPLPNVVTDEASLQGLAGRNQPQFTSCCIQARKPGFLNDPNQLQGVEVTLGAEPIVALIPEGLIKGRVSLPSSDAAVGIYVELFTRQVQDGMFHWVQGNTVRANSNGEFRFAELRPGEYKLVTHELMDTDLSTMLPGAQLYGFPPVYFPGALDFSAAVPIQLKAGQTFEADISPVRQAYYQVRIPVADEVGNAAVTVSIQGHQSPGYSLGYSSERHRIEGLLPNGTYTVSLETPGANPASGMVSLSVAGSPAEGPKLVLSRHSSTHMNVSEEFQSTDWNGSASWTDGKRTFQLHGPRLYLQAIVEPVDDLNNRGGRSIRPPTGPDDTLVIEDLPQGRYALRLSSSRGYAASATADGVDLLQEPLLILAGSNPTIDITMRDDFATVEGTLSNVSGALDAAKPGYSNSYKPIAFIYFVPLHGGTGQYLQTVVNPDGKFEQTNVAPGNYLVLAFENQQMDLPYRDAEAMKTYEHKGQTVRMVPGQKVKLELQISSSIE
jgi:hypothetical protein